MIFDLLTVVMIKLSVIIVGMYYFFNLSLPYRIFIFQAAGAIITETTGLAIVRSFHQSNLWVFNIFYLLEHWMLALAGFCFLRKIWASRIIIPLLLFITLVWVWGVYTSGIFVFYTSFGLAHHIILVLIYLAVLYYSIVFRRVKLRKHPQLWISLSVIIFYGCELPFQGMFTYLAEHHPEILKALFHPIVWTLNFIRYPMTAYALYLAGSQDKKSISIYLDD